MKTFIVLGMHRSATSLVSKALHEAGVNMGDNLLRADSGNPHGYWEDSEFLELNKVILSQCGGSWRNPPPAKAIRNHLDNKNIMSMIEYMVKKRNAEFQFWGIKDPRMSLVVELYMPFLIQPHFIVCFRDPREVAASLHKRNRISIDQGVALAKEYNKRILSFLGKTHVN